LNKVREAILDFSHSKIDEESVITELETLSGFAQYLPEWMNPLKQHPAPGDQS
jgi:hypothetical protein